MSRETKPKGKPIEPGGVSEYIERCPEEIRGRLAEVRVAVQQAAPGAVETVSYFQMPGYSYEGYDYSGMFAWFSFKAPHVRLHVRPPVLEDHAEEVSAYATTKAIVSFPMHGPMPKSLIKKLVKASVRVMKQK